MTVVAESAMISDDNVKFLRGEKLNYIVAARTANLSPKLIAEISKELGQKDETTIRITSETKGKKLSYELNQDLINKATLLLGIKGYYTNCNNLTDLEIINQYKQLWQVEKAFRISKSDLKTRPIFHNKQQAIEAHIPICFMALAIAKFIEIKAKKSIRSVVKELKKVTDARLYDEIGKREFIKRSKINDVIEEILRVV